MAVKPEVAINIGSEFTGKKAFKQAETATTKLQKGVKNLAKSLGLAFSVTALVAFSRKSVRAFQDAEREAAQLASALEAINLGFASPLINEYIDDLALLSGVTGKDLTNAFISLSQATNDTTQAQDLLGVALDISAATGKNLQTVSMGLQRAFKGEVTSLARLRIGLTTAELAGKDFDEVLGDLRERFSGSAARAADTFAGKMARLKEAGDLASEAFGKGLVSGIEASGQSIEDLQKDIISLGETLGKLTAGVNTFASDAISAFNRVGESSAVQGLLNVFEALVRGVGFIVTGELVPTMDATTARLAVQERNKNERANKATLRLRNMTLKTEKQILATQKNTTKEKDKQLKLDKAALSLGKGEDVFDLDQIQIAAAILATQENIQRLGVNATDQQKLQLANDAQRLTVKQLMLDLEDAIAAKDVERATSLSKQLNTELAILGTLTGQTYKLGQIDKILASFVPKDLINLDNLDEAIRKLLEIAGSRFDFLSPIMPSQDRSGLYDLHPDMYTAYRAGDPGAVAAVNAHTEAIGVLAESELALADALLEESIRALDIATASLSPSVATSSRGFDPAAFRMADNITINVNAGVIGSEDTVEQAVQTAILSLERKGDPLRYTGGL
jgi:hypothetical protein